jgi:hypothetical protein
VGFHDDVGVGWFPVDVGAAVGEACEVYVQKRYGILDFQDPSKRVWPNTKKQLKNKSGLIQVLPSTKSLVTNLWTGKTLLLLRPCTTKIKN